MRGGAGELQRLLVPSTGSQQHQVSHEVGLHNGLARLHRRGGQPQPGNDLGAFLPFNLPAFLDDESNLVCERHGPLLERVEINRRSTVDQGARLLGQTIDLRAEGRWPAGCTLEQGLKRSGDKGVDNGALIPSGLLDHWANNGVDLTAFSNGEPCEQLLNNTDAAALDVGFAGRKRAAKFREAFY
jgi:hypothetical protein